MALFGPPPNRPTQRRTGGYPVIPATTVVTGLAGSAQPDTRLSPRAITRRVVSGCGAAGALTKTTTRYRAAGVSRPGGCCWPAKVRVVGGLTGTSGLAGWLGTLQAVHLITAATTPTGTRTAAVTHRRTSAAGAPSATLIPWKIRYVPLADQVASTSRLRKTVIHSGMGVATANGRTAKTDTRWTSGTAVATGNVITRRLPESGRWMAPPLPLPAAPLAGSVITWTARVPPGATLRVKTSVDGGASWQAATNGAPIPRLVAGTTVAKVVLVRVSMAVAHWSVPSPSLRTLNVLVSTDASAPQWCPLGVFLLDDVQICDTPAGVVLTLSGDDLSRKIARNTWAGTYTIAPGTNYADAIAGMVRDRMPEAVLNFTSTLDITPQLQFGQQSSNDPWADIQKLAEAIGCEIFFDPRGVCALRPVPDPVHTPASWTFDDRDHPTITALTRSLSDKDSYNQVIVTGEGSGNTQPVRAIAVDDDPASPTYYLGPCGTVTYRYTSSTITTEPQAQTVAQALLRQVKGATERVELDVIPMSALEPGDVVAVDRGRTAVAGRFLLDRFTIPLGPEKTMHATARRQRLT